MATIEADGTASMGTEPATVIAQLVNDRGMPIKYGSPGEGISGRSRRQLPSATPACPNNPSEIASRDWRKCWSRDRHFRMSHNDQF
jgi:hypothetical protein